VRKAQTEVPGILNNVACLDTDDDILFTTRKDRIHYNANGQINMGKLLAAKLIKLNGGSTAIHQSVNSKINPILLRKISVNATSFSYN
jgi:hypothetical protein